MRPEDDAGRGVGGLVLDTEARPLGVVGARRDGGDKEGQDVHHGVDLARDAHVEEDDGADEHAQEPDEQKVAHRVRVVIRKGHRRRVVLVLSSAAVTMCQTQVRCMDVSGLVLFARTRRAVRLRELVQLRSAGVVSTTRGHREDSVMPPRT